MKQWLTCVCVQEHYLSSFKMQVSLITDPIHDCTTEFYHYRGLNVSCCFSLVCMISLQSEFTGNFEISFILRHCLFASSSHNKQVPKTVNSLKILQRAVCKSLICSYLYYSHSALFYTCLVLNCHQWQYLCQGKGNIKPDSICTAPVGKAVSHKIISEGYY